MNIFVCGVPRAGKTTLCKMLKKNFGSFNILSGEAIRNGFQKMDFQNFKEWGNQNSKQRKEDLQIFLKEFIFWNKFFTGCNVIFDLAILNIEQVVKIANSGDKIICLGFGEKEENQIFDNIRKYETKQDYTTDKSNKDLLRFWGNISQEDKKNMEFCQKNNIEYYDTSTNRENILTEILNNFKDIEK